METTKTIKGKEVIAYKGMKYDMTCRDFKYEVGKSYKTDKVKLCKCGFHACLNPRDVLEYYKQIEGSRYFKVKLSGEIAKCGKYYTEVAATEITILEEITDTFNEVIETAEWWKSENVLDLLYWSDGFALVKKGDGLWNFIDRQGKYLSDEWFKDVFNFYEGFAVVQRVVDEKYNFINKKGKFLSDEWFHWVDNFIGGFAVVKRSDNLYNFINTKGKIISNEWFKDVFNFYEGFAVVQRVVDEKYNFINKKGKFLSDEWFHWVDNFIGGFAVVKRSDNLYNFINTKGKIISNEWFKDVYYLDDGLARVKRANGEWAKIDKTGKLYKA